MKAQAVKVSLPKNTENALPAREGYPFIPDHFITSATHKLVVLVPPGDLDEPDFIRRVGRIGEPQHWKVMFVALADAPQDTGMMRRRLTMMGALSKALFLETSTTLISRRNWIAGLQALLRSGDVLVVPENLSSLGPSLSRVSLAHQVLSNLEVAVYVLPGVPAQAAGHWRNILVWLAALLSIVVLSGLLILITRFFTGGAGTVLQMIALVVELLFLYKICQVE